MSKSPPIQKSERVVKSQNKSYVFENVASWGDKFFFGLDHGTEETIQNLPHKARNIYPILDLLTTKKRQFLSKFLLYADTKYLLRNELYTLIQKNGIKQQTRKDLQDILIAKYSNLFQDGEKISDIGKSFLLQDFFTRCIEHDNDIQNFAKLSKVEIIQLLFPDVKLDTQTIESHIDIVFSRFALTIFASNLVIKKLSGSTSISKKLYGFATQVGNVRVVVMNENTTEVNGSILSHELAHHEQKLQTNTDFGSNIFEEFLTSLKTESFINIVSIAKIYKKYCIIQMTEEVLAHFMGGQEFTVDSYTCYSMYFREKNPDIFNALRWNFFLSKTERKLLLTQIMSVDKTMYDIAMQARAALKIFDKKNYPREWVLTALSFRHAYKNTIHPKNWLILAHSLPEYSKDNLDKLKRKLETQSTLESLKPKPVEYEYGSVE
jgi:hypothetical protein